MLVIEDEEDLRFTLARAISMLPGTMVLEAPDLRTARRAISLHKDLCLGITDVRLPDGNGLDLIRELRQANNLLPFVVMTGYHNADVVLDAYRLGALRYLAKPFELDGFLTAINETLEWSKLIYGMDDTLTTPLQGWIEITSRAQYESADRMREFLASLASLNLDRAERNDLRLAVEELVQNAIEWGNKEDPEKHIHVSYAVFSDRILIMIRDEGEGFKMSEVPDPTIDPFEHLQRRLSQGKRAGGYGIHLTRRMVDDIIYNADGNAVIITKFIGEKRPGQLS
jgi:anti-sigma regulatory factor (Ser/Thr protein kinase)/CheY-like chemotaxis protein